MLFFFYVAVYNYLKATDDLKTVICALAAFTIINMMVIVADHHMGIYQPHGVFPHQNCMAMAMHLFGTLFFALYLRFGISSPIAKLCALAFVCAAVATVRSLSRMALALMPIGYGISFLFCVFIRRPHQWLIRILPIVCVGIIGAAIMHPSIIDRFQNAPNRSKTTRVELALCAWEMIKDEPLRGIGINNWGKKINPPYDYAEKAGRVTNRSEGFADGIVETVYLLVCAECGIPALIAMVAWFGWYLLRCLFLMKRLSDTQWFFVPAGLCGGLTIAYIQSLFEWVFRQQLNLICLMFIFAIISYLDKSFPVLISKTRHKKKSRFFFHRRTKRTKRKLVLDEPKDITTKTTDSEPLSQT